MKEALNVLEEVQKRAIESFLRDIQEVYKKHGLALVPYADLRVTKLEPPKEQPKIEKI